MVFVSYTTFQGQTLPKCCWKYFWKVWYNSIVLPTYLCSLLEPQPPSPSPGKNLNMQLFLNISPPRQKTFERNWKLADLKEQYRNKLAINLEIVKFQICFHKNMKQLLNYRGMVESIYR